MNCLEFRRQKLADPHALRADALQHQSGCNRCHDFSLDVDTTEQALLKAFLHRVPEGLAERILLKRRRPALRNVSRWAMAASIVLLLSVAAMSWMPPAEADYAQLAIEHVRHEPQALTSTRNDDTTFFEKILADFGGTPRASLGRVRYAKLCGEPDGTGWHVVLETAEGLATLILVPNDHVKGRTTASAHDWHALVQPAGRGYVAIVTQNARQTAAVEHLLRENVRWNTGDNAG